ncbi:preprotein translocase subunit SecA [Candidatus Babeliales bacterium]|nr:preprotein translocase subunit SecA [Candidatus Babeliales bacterium]
MITKIIAKVFGTSNDRKIKKLRAEIIQINQLEEKMISLSDEELSAKTPHFRERLSQGEKLESIMPEAFAVVRETSKRKLQMRHFDVQLMGGIVLHQGKVAEMKTGEGKTLVATLPLYLNALEGKSSHLITVNDYLAKRDSEWMSPIYKHLGLEVAALQNSMEDEERKKAYNSDILYGTNNEFGFDYLRDNMKFDLEEYVQRKLNYAIVDEVDSILIDEARTPLIISGPSEKGGDLYAVANRIVHSMQKNADFEVDEKARTVLLTEAGTDKAERAFNIENLYAPENVILLHHAQQALKAHALFKRDVDYIVNEGNVLIVDEFTGRTLAGRRYSDGLHQALEAKEGVKVERENQTLATITLQNYFRMYDKLAGMTGTAMTEAAEFHRIYKLDAISIPTHKPLARNDEDDIVFLTQEDKYNAALEDIIDAHKKGQPVLVGTGSVEASELVSTLLNRSKIPHNVLNAKNHAKEADIVKEAGEQGKVTISTSMAGRGTDIKLGNGVREVGGLRVISTERHENRRIDDQLRGRSGRQGDPGSSKFYVSLEDDLMRIFGGDRTKQLMTRWGGMQKGESIEHGMVSRLIRNNQEKMERHNFDIRKHLLEYDDVMNQQRNVIYEYRHEILEGHETLLGLIKEIIAEVIGTVFETYAPHNNCDEECKNQIIDKISSMSSINEKEFDKVTFNTNSTSQFQSKLVEFLCYNYKQYRAQLPEEMVSNAEKWVVLEIIDFAWKAHLQNLDHLKEGIGLRGYGQKNPLHEYKKESFDLFSRMMGQIKWDIVRSIFKLRSSQLSQEAIDKIEREKEKELSEIQVGGDNTSQQTVRRKSPKVGRNEPCPCGSGKKFKQCCGKN